MAPKSEVQSMNNHQSLLEPLVVCKDIKNSKYYFDPLSLLGETNFKEPQEIPDDIQGTPIQEFFRGAKIFLTGGTGFMGKILIEKLLRSCPHIKHIYLLIRPKKGKGIQDRLDGIFADRLFKRLKHEVPKFQHKVSAVSGDCSLPGLGLNQHDRELIANEVDIIFHGAATVRFNEPLRMALAINVQGTKALLQLAKEVKNLRSMVHVSTAFANCPNMEIDEKFYPVPNTYEDVLETVSKLSDEEIEEMLPTFLGKWPNSYTYTKALAEHVVKNESQGLPIAIFRPAVVITTYREPVRGWIDNLYGPVGLIVGAGTGVLHTYHATPQLVTDMVPVDLTVNSLIATAWQTGKIAKEQKSISIYNYVSSAQNPVVWADFIKLNYRYGIYWPTIRAVWYYSFYPFENKFLFMLATLFFHTIPGMILDALAKLSGQKPMLGKIYDRLAKVEDTLEYFSNKEWTFHNNNVQNLWKQLTPEDQNIFFFDMAQMSWEYQTEALCLGMRVYLLKDDVDTLPEARKKWNRLYFAHITLKAIVAVLLLHAVWTVFSSVYQYVAS